ncbi:MAG: hypothetical protein ACE5HT_08295 [Gemmatimonadales bacterium]
MTSGIEILLHEVEGSCGNVTEIAQGHQLDLLAAQVVSVILISLLGILLISMIVRYEVRGTVTGNVR